MPVPDYAGGLAQPVKGLRNGIPTGYFPYAIDPAIAKLLEVSLDEFRSLGCEIVEVAIPGVDAWNRAGTAIMAVEAARCVNISHLSCDQVRGLAGLASLVCAGGTSKHQSIRKPLCQDLWSQIMRSAKPIKQLKSQARSTEGDVAAEGVFDPSGLPTGPTGRHLVVLRDIGQKSLAKALKNTAGLNAASSADFEGAAVSEKDIGKSDALIFEHLGVALVDADPSQLSSIRSAVADNSNPIVSVEPEEYVYALHDDYPQGESLISAAGLNYLRGYQDAVGGLIAGLTGAAPADLGAEAGIAATYNDTAALTWGLQATLASNSLCTGGGIRVAVLDTGFDLAHPDFAGRSPITTSFVPGEAVQDGHGHGTHCIGTSCGPKAPAGTARRYGIGTNAIILAGKVLSNAGSGADAWILAGINWAVQNRAIVISMSLGAPVAVGAPFKQAYEQAAQAALNAGCLIVAAAGNNGNTPVGSPANCPSIMAVAAVDQNLQRAPFSCIGINPNGGEVNIAGPGVGVYSSTKLPTRYTVMSGTSMATPHVAGCAALWAQNTGLRGQPLWNRLISSARNIGLPAQQVGAGLVQAPPCRVIIPRPVPRPIPLPIPRPFP